MTQDKLTKLWDAIREHIKEVESVWEVLDKAVDQADRATPASLNQMGELLAQWLFPPAAEISRECERIMFPKKEAATR